MKKQKTKICLMIDNDLKRQIDDHRAQIQEETGLKIAFSEIGASLLRKALADGKDRRKLKTTPKRNKPGSIRLDPSAPILAQVRNL